MKRRILLVITTLAALGSAFYVYWLVAGRDTVARRLPTLALDPCQGAAVRPQAGVSLQDVTGLRIEARDRNGRLEGMYLADRWQRREDGSYLLLGVRVELLQKNGQRMVLRADRAEVYGEELDRGVNVRRAYLSGNVRVYFDPATDPDLPPVEERAEEVVRVLMDDVEFDRERLSIETTGPVTVYSPEADIYGQGLSISWNESPRELRTLRIDHGRYMAVYNVPAELDMIALPGSEAQAAPPATAPAGTTRPAGLAPAAPATAPATRPTTAPGTAIVRIGTTTAPAASQPASQPASAPAERQPQNQYVAEFRENIRVVQRSRRLEGADRLSLRFDWDSSWRGGESPLGGRRRRRREEAASRPATTLPTSRPAATTAPTQPDDGPEPMEIYWTGPLVLRPVGRTEDPRQRYYEVAATGANVVLTDPRATVGCREFFFRHPEQSGFLKGTAKAPARLLLAEGADVACRTIRFEPASGRAYLDGPGYMVRRFPDGLPQDQALALMAMERPLAPPAGERITWGRNVEIAFATERVRRPDGTAETRQTLREADFHENVLLQQGPDPNDDFVRCDRLKVSMAPGRRMAAYPKQAVATGNVSARQEGADVRADTITVHFQEARKGAAQVVKALSGGVQPSTVVAEGNVSVTDRREGEEPMVARADRLTSNLVDRTAVLRGKPARIEQGPNHLTGEEIRLDQADGSAVVDGAGKVGFLTRRDMNGRQLAEPRLLAVVWTKRMSFHGSRRMAAFNGDVALDSGMDQVHCGEMQILFAETPEPARASQPATRPAEERQRRFGGMAVEMERYSRRKISMILADKDITLRSRRENDANQLLRRVQLAGQRLIYDAENARMTMLGRGTFVAEDYNPPRRREPAGESQLGLGGTIDRPSQTAFEWDRSMQFSQASRVVVLDGQVTMVHRSGDKVVLAEMLNVPREQWGELKDGRRTILKCDNMLAKFAPADKPATQPAGDVLEQGPDLGPVEMFSATKDVNLKDGPWQVVAQRLVYDRVRDLAVIWGFTEGAPVASATVYNEDPTTGRSQSWASPKIVWYRQNNRIVTEEVTGAGGR